MPITYTFIVDRMVKKVWWKIFLLSESSRYEIKKMYPQEK